MPGSLYDEDILAWSEQQAALLRDLARHRDLPNALDLENVAEEIESVGRDELRATKRHQVHARPTLRDRGAASCRGAVSGVRPISADSAGSARSRSSVMVSSEARLMWYA